MDTKPTTYDDDVLILIEHNEHGCHFVACHAVQPSLLASNDLSESIGPDRTTMHEACWKTYDTAWRGLYADDAAAIEDSAVRAAEARIGA